MLMPSRTKYRKVRKGRIHGGSATSMTELAYGHYGLISKDSQRISSRQIEAARQAMTRYIKRGGQIWIRVFPHIPVSLKPLGTKMGSGKGNPEFFVAKVKPGTVIFEMDGVSEDIAREAIRLAGHKLPLNSGFIMKDEQ
ncbi:50S ribosomal protein L16 [Candidatus Saccharibacteria bacterium]|nr:50S ribosomal protein L16 [Candidatus Saccharibacteria bacterium]